LTTGKKASSLKPGWKKPAPARRARPAARHPESISTFTSRALSGEPSLPIGPALKGVAEGDFARRCARVCREVRDYLTAAVESICRAVPDLAGFFTITGSETLRTAGRTAAAAVARAAANAAGRRDREVNATFCAGIRRAGRPAEADRLGLGAAR